jgi:ribosomal protein S11
MPRIKALAITSIKITNIIDKTPEENRGLMPIAKKTPKVISIQGIM